MTGAASAIIPPDWPRWSATEPALIGRLSGGLTNQSFLIAAGKDKWVLRRNSAFSDALDLNRAAEAAALRHADKAGLCAPLIYCDPGYRYLVTRYIEGKPWRATGAGELRRLAQLLSSIHALPAIDARLDIEDKVANYWRSIDKRADFYRELQLLDQSVRSHIAAAQSLNSGTRLCHNDLLSTNLIATNDGNLYAIDWEYAAMGDPFYELAVIVAEYRLDEQQQSLLLSGYLNCAVTQIHRQRIEHWRVIYGYLSALWYAVQWSTGAMSQSGISDEIANRIRDVSELSSAIIDPGTH